jgi:glycosyltransferase involved in cell wall biosynthesis
MPVQSARSVAEEMPGVERRITYISWAESCSRSDHTARELGGTSHMVYASQFGSRPATILYKYVVQWVRTSRILKQERPDVVFVMTPPVFAALPAFWYAVWRGKSVVLDAHSAAFLHPRWRLFQWLQRLLCRRAATTLVHNDHLAEQVRAMGARAVVVRDVPIVFSGRGTFQRPTGFVVAAVCSFNYDEPIAEIVRAAEMMPDITFFMTGNARHLDPRLKAELPANVHLTGFLSTEDYGTLLTTADAVLTLTTRDHTMLRGAYEAVYQGTPVIVSDWPILREAFAEGAAHVDNTVGQIVRAVRDVQARADAYRAGSRRLRTKKLRQWAVTRQELLQHVVGHHTP